MSDDMRPILDNHLHLSPSGAHVEAVKVFEKAGGTHIILSHLRHGKLNWSENFEQTLKLAENVRENTDVVVFVTLGPYPMDILELLKTHSMDVAKAIMCEGMELAAEHIAQGTAIALGEIGRPHFEVTHEIWDASNAILLYGMELARDLDCAVVLHTEKTADTFGEIAELARDAGLRTDRLVMHYSPPLIKAADNFGLMPSILAGKENVKRAIAQGDRFLMETDYLDDPKRPGAVLGIKTVPRRTKEFLADGSFTEGDVHKIHVEHPMSVYGVDFE